MACGVERRRSHRVGWAQESGPGVWRVTGDPCRLLTGVRLRFLEDHSVM